MIIVVYKKNLLDIPTGFLFYGCNSIISFASHIFPAIGLVPKACGVYFPYLDIRGFLLAASPNER